MNRKLHTNLTPQEYILQLFEDTQNGVLSITYQDFLGEPYTLRYQVDWTREDALALVERYTQLTEALARIAPVHSLINDETINDKNLSAEDKKVWETYIRLFPPFEVDEAEIAQLYFRRETETLSEEEDDLLERHHQWFRVFSLQRLPFIGTCPAFVINKAMGYETLIRLHKKEAVVAEEGKALAEEMILYYHKVDRTPWDLSRIVKAQEKVYMQALTEIRRGKKYTHWMWFIFPQLRGLGTSKNAHYYGLANTWEAKAYLADPLLGARLKEITAALLQLEETDPEKIFGEIDAMKLRSSMSLFAAISEPDSVFHQTLQKFFPNNWDPTTLDLMGM